MTEIPAPVTWNPRAGPGMDLAGSNSNTPLPPGATGGEGMRDWLAYTVAICAGLLTMMLVGQLPLGR